MQSDHHIFCCPLLLQPSVFPSIMVVFQDVSSSHQVAKLLELPLQCQSFQLIFRINFLYDWRVWSPCCSRDCQEFPSVSQFETSILQHSTFFIVQLSHPYMTTGKTIALTIWTLVGKPMSLLFIMLSRFGINFLPRNKCLLILWLQSL